MSEEKFTWMNLLKSVNELPDEFLNEEVVIWWQDNEGGTKAVEVMRLKEDYADSGNGLEAMSDLKKYFDPEEVDEPFETAHPVVFKKGHPIVIAKNPF